MAPTSSASKLRVGDRLLVTRPKHHFNLEDATFHALIAGGIGVTPIMTFAEELARRGAPFSLTYGGRTADSMAFRARLAALGDRVTYLAEDVDGRPDLDAMVRSVPPGGLVYVCGPCRCCAPSRRPPTRCTDPTRTSCASSCSPGPA